MTNEQLRAHGYTIVWDGARQPLAPPPTAAALTIVEPARVRDLLDRSYPEALTLRAVAFALGTSSALAWPGLERLLSEGLAVRVKAKTNQFVRTGSGRPPAWAYRAAMRRES